MSDPLDNVSIYIEEGITIGRGIQIGMIFVGPFAISTEDDDFIMTEDLDYLIT
jgi:hypothetical protein